MHEIGRQLPRTHKTEIKNPKRGHDIDVTDYDTKQKKIAGANRKTSNVIINDTDQAQISAENSNARIKIASSDKSSGTY